MPRQRKPQNGGQRLWTGRVANTTTGSTTTQTVYRIPTWNRRDCDVRNFEITWTSPIAVAIEWENVYRISLDMAALESAIEEMDLNLSNVTLQTVNWDVTFTGNITAEGEFTWTTINATTWNITNIVSNSITADAISTDDLNTDWLTVTNNATVGGTLWVTWATNLNSTLTVGWTTTVNSDLTVAWGTSTNAFTANNWTIATLVATTTTTNSVTVNNDAVVNRNLSVAGNSTLHWVNATDVNTSWNLSVAWTSAFTGAITAWDITSNWNASLNNVAVAWNETITGTLGVNWATTLNNSLTVAWASTLSGNASVGGNLSVAGNSTVTGNQTVTWDAIFSSDVSVANDLTVSWDATVTDDLTVNGSTHLKTLETTGSTSLGWNLSVDWSIAGWSNLVVENQIESGSLVTTNITTDNITINGNIALGNDATAPDFILQDEKGAPNGVAPLDANGQINSQYLPEVFTTAKCKVVQWVFNNSNTAVVVDEDITNDAWVKVSNYQDVIGDTTEVISVGQIVVTSNTVETWSFKVLIVKPLS